jgi:hypothetical protein
MVSMLYFVKTIQIYYFKLKQDLFCSIKIKKMIFLPSLGRRKKKSGPAHRGQTRSETDLPLPSLGKQEAKPIRPCPSWGNEK